MNPTMNPAKKIRRLSHVFDEAGTRLPGLEVELDWWEVDATGTPVAKIGPAASEIVDAKTLKTRILLADKETTLGAFLADHAALMDRDLGGLLADAQARAGQADELAQALDATRAEARALRELIGRAVLDPEAAYLEAFRVHLGLGSAHGYDDVADLLAHAQDAASPDHDEALAGLAWRNGVLDPAFRVATTDPVPAGFRRDWQAWAHGLPAFVYPPPAESPSVLGETAPAEPPPIAWPAPSHDAPAPADQPA